MSLVVLSACKSLVGDADREFGLGGAIWEQGSESTFGSLWTVSDPGTMAMMKIFYEILSQDLGLTRAQLLQEAQLAMLELRVEIKAKQLVYKTPSQEGEDQKTINRPLPPSLQHLGDQTFEKPYYWSAFELLGNAY